MPQMVIPDYMPQIVWLCLIFPLIYLSMKYFALPRIASIISRREEKIRSDISKAEEIKNFLARYLLNTVEQTNKELQLLINNTDNEIKNVINNIHKENQEEAEVKMEKSQKLLGKKLDESKSEIEKNILSFQNDIDSIAEDTTKKILEKLSYKLSDPSIIKKEIEKERNRIKNWRYCSRVSI